MPSEDIKLTDTFIRISGMDNQMEAQLLDSILDERAIPHRICSFHDTAYDGLYQAQKGWGEITAPFAYKRQIEEILEQIRTASEPVP
ncbi:MAG: hypothetical protein GXP53_02380 [Deltaproteobacteria bacterium]|nr:hypothetical protein [Deltaproteobacteria bacterium]